MSQSKNVTKVPKGLVSRDFHRSIVDHFKRLHREASAEVKNCRLQIIELACEVVVLRKQLAKKSEAK